MKVKLGHSYNYVEREDGHDIDFFRGEVYPVIATFEHPEWGVDDHTVYVIKNPGGDTISLSAKVVTVCK